MVKTTKTYTGVVHKEVDTAYGITFPEIATGGFETCEDPTEITEKAKNLLLVLFDVNSEAGFRMEEPLGREELSELEEYKKDSTVVGFVDATVTFSDEEQSEIEIGDVTFYERPDL